MDKIDKYINSRSKELSDWGKEFHFSTFEYNKTSGNVSFIAYERTLSAYLNLKIYETIKPLYPESFFVNEFAIKNNTFCLTDKKALSSEIVTTKRIYKDNEWDKYCVFDGYFFSKEGFKIEDNVFQHFFVEYKLDDCFVFVKLATDYLKYKLFTKNIINNSAFCYVIIEKDETNPNIINLFSTNKIFYKLIGKTIAESTLPIANVYFYLPNVGISKTPSESVINSLTIIEKSIEEFDQLKKVELFTANEMSLIDLAQKFKKNVLTSELILSNYEYIKQIFEKANEKKVFDVLIKNSDDDSLINEGAGYNVNLEAQLTEQRRVDAEENGLHANNKTSLNYLSLLDYFNEGYLKSFLKPNYKSKTIGRGKRKHEIKNEEIAKKNWIVFDEHFGLFTKEEKTRRILVLAYSILSCTTKLIPILYEKDENGNYSENSKEKESYKLAKIGTKFDEAISLLKKEIHYDGTFGFSSVIGENIEQMKFLKSLFEFYN